MSPKFPTRLRAYHAFDGFSEGTNGRAWVLAIVYSVFVNNSRRRRQVPVHVSIDELEARHAETLAAPQFTPPDATQGSWPSDDVERAMTKLPDAFRETERPVDVVELSLRGRDSRHGMCGRHGALAAVPRGECSRRRATTVPASRRTA